MYLFTKRLIKKLMEKKYDDYWEHRHDRKLLSVYRSGKEDISIIDTVNVAIDNLIFQYGVHSIFQLNIDIVFNREDIAKHPLDILSRETLRGIIAMNIYQKIVRNYNIQKAFLIPGMEYVTGIVKKKITI